MKNLSTYAAIVLAILSILVVFMKIGNPTVPLLLLVAAVIVGYFGSRQKNSPNRLSLKPAKELSRRTQQPIRS